MAHHGTIGEFDPGKEDWASYTERLQLYFMADDVDDANKQRAILLSVCGPKTYQLIRNLIAPAKPTDKSLEEITRPRAPPPRSRLLSFSGIIFTHDSVVKESPFPYTWRS